MLKEINKKDTKALREYLSARTQEISTDILQKVNTILQDVHSRGDEALRAYTKEFDRIDIAQFRVTPEEIDETRLDEHYTEFLSVMNFLNEDPETESKFLTVWRDYSIRLKELTLGDTTILSAKDAAEDAMYQTVCRTERISAAENADDSIVVRGPDTSVREVIL